MRDLDCNAHAATFFGGVPMRSQIAFGAVVVVLAACSGDQPAPTQQVIRTPLFAAGGNRDFNLGTHLRGDEEVLVPTPPSGLLPSDSPAQGQAIFRVSDDGSSVDFRLIASNIDNVIMAHIHCGRAGANGPIRMWLSPVIGPAGAAGPSGAGRHDGVLATGTFSPAGVVCPASAVGRDMPLLDAMRAGLTYVNVHTNDGVAPTNTGPGDFPGGEIRGQLDAPPAD
jgi:hypothetical protein